MSTDTLDISLVRGPTGWGFNSSDSVDTRLDTERRKLEALYNDIPIVSRARVAKDYTSNPIYSRYLKFMESLNYGSGSCDLSVIDKFVFGRTFAWLPQKTGSCVISNTFRPWVRRALFEIVMDGQAEEFLGKDEFTTKSISFYAPFSYGCGRRRGKLKGGDGGFCAEQYESFIKDGVIPCNNGKLNEILTKLNAVQDKDFPEPQNNDVYRRFQNWEFLDTLLPFADYRLLEAPEVTNVDMLVELAKQFKPASICSGVAIHKIGKHKDGFDIHARNPRDSWAHNMSFQGFFYSSDGKMFVRLSYDRWRPGIVHNVPVEEVARWFSLRDISVIAIGEIDLPDSVPTI